MGIPHLITYLRPYTVSEPLSGQSVVIDGPGWAYYIYHLCLSMRQKARNQFEAAVTYEELGKVGILWLDALRSNGVSIKKIYFDGALPISKRDVRVGRLIRQTHQLQAYYKTYPVPCRVPSAVHALLQDQENLFAHKSVRDGLTKLPPLPFLVPAVLEALLASDFYKIITEVVPGEADVYCAQELKDQMNGGVVLTGDSDLLVHDVGADGAVAFLKDIEYATDAQLGNLRCEIYRPALIAGRLGLPNPHGLHAMAFEMKMDTHGAFAKLLQQAKLLYAIKNHQKEYEDFKREYSIPTKCFQIESKQPKVVATLRCLDPRISEYVLQFPSLSKLAGSYTTSITNDPTPHIFIPFLLDCPARTNAWESSMSVRQLAYGLINLIVPVNEHKSTIFEHKRQEGKIGGRELQLPSTSQTLEACTNIIDTMSKISTSVRTDVSELNSWIIFAVCKDVEWSHGKSKVPLSNLAGQHISSLEDKSNTEKCLNWEILQFYSQIQASHYSLRILKQMLGLLASQDHSSALQEPILQLHDVMKTLPPISSIEGLTNITSLLRTVKDLDLVGTAERILGISSPPLRSSNPKDVSKKLKRKRKRDTNTETLGNHKQSTNPFSILGMK